MKNSVKILILVAVLGAIAGVWLIKNVTTLQSDTSANALEATTLDAAELFGHGLPVILDFGASWCQPCQEFMPVLKRLHKELGDEVIIRYIDVDESLDIASEFPVSVIPTQLFYYADGTPFTPPDELGLEFQYYANLDGNHAYTTHQGALTEENFRAIVEALKEGPQS